MKRPHYIVYVPVVHVFYVVHEMVVYDVVVGVDESVQVGKVPVQIDVHGVLTPDEVVLAVALR